MRNSIEELDYIKEVKVDSLVSMVKIKLKNGKVIFSEQLPISNTQRYLKIRKKEGKATDRLLSCLLVTQLNRAEVSLMIH